MNPRGLTKEVRLLRDLHLHTREVLKEGTIGMARFKLGVSWIFTPHGQNLSCIVMGNEIEEVKR